MKTNDIIIVGNGPSVLHREKGAEIDNFNKVVRINNFAIDGYEKFVGTKTNIWTRSASDLVYDRCDSSFELVLWLVALPAWERRPDKIGIISELIKESESRNILVSKTEIDRINEKYFQNKTEVKPSTGLYTIFYFLERFSQITIHGFDFFASHTTKMHYFDCATKKRMNGHDIDLEKNIVQKLVSSGKVITL